jgi:SAM-dependent methyltransferase
VWRKLLDVLADPATGEPLELLNDPGGDWIPAGELASPSGARFPIIRGVPRFVNEGYAESFGLQWNRFARVQLDSANGGSYSRDRFDNELQWTRADLDGQWTVDAGCGSGRFAEIAASYGAEVVAVDLSSAVDAAADNLSSLSNVHVVQADITRLPLQRHRIRFLYSIGVLQHTPHPVATARKLVEFLVGGSRFGFTIYGRRPWTFLYSKYLVRPLTRRVPPPSLLAGIEKAMPVLFPVTSFLYSVPFVGRATQFVLPVANYPWQRDLPRNVRYDQAVLDTFDMLSPRYDRPVRAEEIWAALDDLCDEMTFLSTVPVVIHGRRASTGTSRPAVRTGPSRRAV